ncbi:unnamed protein product [Somion occarium]|uniref:STAS domain-containing protein n=1 Tax=Somion occarium TaxID=3059160 RepID=A0ABP1DAN0_9APHY
MASRVKKFGKRVIGYHESVPVVSVKDWASHISRDPKRDAREYLESLFPILQWITRYNFGWLYGDVIAGLTVGMVVVPQSMSYAQIATLPPEYGLYSAFIIKHVQDNHPGVWEGPQIATTVAFISGIIVLGIGILRLGWLVEFIPAPAVSGFMTGSAVNIVSGQVPGLMGITGFDTRAATYKVIINTLKGLPGTKLDAAWGLTGLFGLYAIRMICDFLSRKYPRRKRLFFFASVFRNAFVIIVLTIASWLYCRRRLSASGKYPIKILQNVPRGFKHVGTPNIDGELVSALAGQLPVATIILLLEHIAISKSFGRVNGYKINPNQELIAIGVTNLIGTVFSAYPATGSFSRSALKSKSGVRTPAAGILTSVVVIVALYGLTAAFFWIPNAGLSAVIIHAVADLVASPSQVYTYWKVSPLEFIIWLAAVLVTIFSSIENGIYTSICASLALLLIRVARPRGYFLGKVTLYLDSTTKSQPTDTRDVYVPLNPKARLMNADVKVIPPAPGIIVYRHEESLVYPNASLVNTTLRDYVKEHMRRGIDMSTVKLSDRPWNDPGPRPGHDENAENLKKPLLKAIVLDFAAVSQIDTTGVQTLIDTRNEVERWTDAPVEFHFATILSPWIRRALVAGGFGTGAPSSSLPKEIAAVVPYRGDRSDYAAPEKSDDIEEQIATSNSETSISSPAAPIALEDTPFFHLDIVQAVRAAERNALDTSDRASVTGSERSTSKL